MSADVVSKSIVDEKTQNEAHSLVVAGLLEFLDVTRSGLLRWFKGFEDLEVAVNKKSLISDNCKALQEYEVAHLVRMTEVFDGTKKGKTQTPRSLVFGIVLMKAGDSTFNVRLWEALTPSWNGGDADDREMNTTEDITKITDELMLSMCKVCRNGHASPKLLENDPTPA